MSGVQDQIDQLKTEIGHLKKENGRLTGLIKDMQIEMDKFKKDSDLKAYTDKKR